MYQKLYNIAKCIKCKIATMAFYNEKEQLAIFGNICTGCGTRSKSSASEGQNVVPKEGST